MHFFTHLNLDIQSLSYVGSNPRIFKTMNRTKNHDSSFFQSQLLIYLKVLGFEAVTSDFKAGRLDFLCRRGKTTAILSQNQEFPAPTSQIYLKRKCSLLK